MGFTVHPEPATTQSVIDVTPPDNIELDDTSSGTYTYLGGAPAGTLESAAAWRIKRIDKSIDPDLSLKQADGDSLYDNVWDDRLSLSYS